MPNPKDTVAILRTYAQTIQTASREIGGLADGFTKTTKNLNQNKIRDRAVLDQILEDLELLQAKLHITLKAASLAAEVIPEADDPATGQPAFSESRTLSRGVEAPKGLEAVDEIMGFAGSRARGDGDDHPPHGPHGPHGLRSISDFLSTIGQSVVASQEALDEQSIRYLQSISDRPFIPPTLFRIPKISAELKVGLSRGRRRELSIIIASSKEELNQMNEQTINFEIAAVPPTPELLEILEGQAPRIEFLFNREGRKEVFHALEHIQPEITEASETRLKEQLARLISAENRDRVLIWPVDQRRSYLILFAGENSKDDVAVWYLDRQNQKLISIIRGDLKSKIGEDQNPLREFVLDLGQAQARLL